MDYPTYVIQDGNYTSTIYRRGGVDWSASSPDRNPIGMIREVMKDKIAHLPI